MTTNLLQDGDEQHCPHCQQLHPVVSSHTEGTNYTVQMLYWRCTKGMYYAGQIGSTSRHRTRKPPRAA